MQEVLDFIGDPGRIRTCDLQLRRLLLYPLSYGATQAVSLYRVGLDNARQIGPLRRFGHDLDTIIALNP